MPKMWTSVNGIQMSVKERNAQMKMEYIRGYEIDELAEKYTLSVDTVNDIRRKDKWVAARRTYRDDRKLYVDGKITQLYAGHKVHVNIKYNLAWQKLMNIIDMCLDNPAEYLLNDNGMPKWGALETVATIIERAQNGQGKANGNMPEEVAISLEIQKEKLSILRQQVTGEMSPDAEQEIVQDNFKEALDNAAKVVWADFTGETKKDLDEVSKGG